MDNLVLVKSILFILWVLSIFAVVMSLLGVIIMAFIPEVKPVVHKQKPPYFSLDQIENMVKDKSTDEAKMEIIVHSFVEHHILPPKEKGKPNKQAKHMLEMIFTLSGHTRMTNPMRKQMFQDLIIRNPEYRSEFQNAS